MPAPATSVPKQCALFFAGLVVAMPVAIAAAGAFSWSGCGIGLELGTPCTGAALGGDLSRVYFLFTLIYLSAGTLLRLNHVERAWPYLLASLLLSWPLYSFTRFSELGAVLTWALGGASHGWAFWSIAVRPLARAGAPMNAGKARLGELADFLRAVETDADMRERLLFVLAKPQAERRLDLLQYIDGLRRRQAPPPLLRALAALLDPEAAARARKLLQPKPRRSWRWKPRNTGTAET